MKPMSIRNCGRVFGLLVALITLLPEAAWAQVSYEVLAMSVTNDTGFVIAADGRTNNSAYNRESLLCDSDVRLGNSGSRSVTVTYYLSYRLLNASGQAHPIYNGDTGTRTNSDYSYRLTNTVTLSPGFAALDEDLASLRPASRLDPATAYTVELRLYTSSGAFTGVSGTNGPHTFYHFTSVVSDDPEYNVIASVDGATFTRTHAVNTDADRRGFLVDVDYTLRRYDNFMGSHLPADAIPVTLAFQLRNTTDKTVVPLVDSSTNFTVLMFKYDPPPPTDPIAPRVLAGSRTIQLIPASGVQLDSVNRQYEVVVTILHTEDPGPPLRVETGNSVLSPARQLLHFNGTLMFGPVQTTFTSIDNVPAPVLTVANSHVSTHLGVDGNSGFVVGYPTYTYGDGTDLQVWLRSNGNAELVLGSTPVNVPTGAPTKVANVLMEVLGPAVLTPTGLRSDIRVTLPTGFGYRADTNGHFLNSRLTWPSVVLGTDLRPATDPVHAPGANFFCAEESKPVWLECSALRWRVSLGRFELTVPKVNPVHYVRQDEYASLTSFAGVLNNSDRDLKRSNDRHFQSVTGLAPATEIVQVVAAPDCTARLSADLQFGPGSFRAHFPYDAAIQWAGTGTMRVVEDNVTSAGSSLTGVGVVGVPYDTGCPGCDAGAPVRNAALVPAGNVLTFTRDGGLVGGGTMFPAHRLEWGWIDSLSEFAHEAFAFADGNLHMPGVFLRGDQVSVPSGQRANALLFSGVAASDPTYVERPDVEGSVNRQRYRQGLADYAGINFVVGADAAKQAESRLGGTPTGPYDLKGNSKYYVRQGGVSGVHDATPGSFPDQLVIYGYPFQFTNFGFNLLDSQMKKSLIRGSIELPYPSEFDQHFDQLKMSCVGALERAEIGAGDITNHLAYWNSTFLTRGLEFRRHPDEPCNATGGFLVLGIETRIAHVPDPLYGMLGFLPDGDLISRSVGVEDLDSRLKLPSLVKFPGPQAEVYSLNPVVDAYFNRWADHPITKEQLGSPESGFGWINMAGSIDLPFFEDLPVHLQFSASQDLENPPIHVMGGWPTENNPANHGWGTAQNNYFVGTYFDDVNRGFATGVTPAAYRDSGSEQFRPRAQRSWIGVVNFDYPLRWFPALRRFRSLAPVENDLLVLRTEHQARNLSPQNAELAFGTQFEFLPTANLANLFFNAIDDATGVAGSLADVLSGNAFAGVTNGFRRLDQLLAPQLIEFYDPAFDALIDPQIDSLYTALAADFASAADPQAFLAGAPQTIAAALQPGQAGNVRDLLVNFAGPNADAPGLMNQAAGALGAAQQGVGELKRLFQKDADGFYGNAASLVLGLVNSFAPEYIGFIAANVVQQYLGVVGGNFDALAEDMTGTQTYFGELGEAIAAPAGLGGEIKARLTSASARAEVDTLVADAAAAVETYLENIHYDLDSPFEDYTPAEIKRFIRREIEDRYHGTTITPAVQGILRQRLYDQDGLLRSAADTALQEVNTVTRDLLKQSAAAISDEFTGWLPDHLKGLAASAGVDGYAKINGDSLKELRLNMKAKLQVMREMEFGAYVQIKELDSGGTPGCDYAGLDATEVSFGANASGLRWFGSDASISVNNKLTFGDPGLLGFAGSFDLNGNIGVGTFAIKRLAAATAFGLTENYISGGGRITLGKKVIAGGLFVGKACVLDPIQLWDPAAASVLGSPPFTGFYGYGELWISINELIGIPSSCLFDLSGGMGLGAGLFLDGPTAVGKMKYGVSGDLLCLVNIKGELTGAASLNLGGLDGSVSDSLAMTAIGELTAKLGYCPFCIPFKVDASATYDHGKWSFKR